MGAVAAYYSYLYIYSAISRYLLAIYRYLLRDVTRYCNYLSNTLDSAAGMRADEPRPRTTHALPSAQAQCPATTLRPAYFYKQTVLCLHRSFNIKTYEYNVCLWYVKCEGDNFSYLFHDLYQNFSQFLVVDAKKENEKNVSSKISKCPHYISITRECRAVVGVVRVVRVRLL